MNKTKHEQNLQRATIGLHKEQTAPEQSVVKTTGGLNRFDGHQIFILGSNVVKIQNDWLARMEILQLSQRNNTYIKKNRSYNYKCYIESTIKHRISLRNMPIYSLVLEVKPSKFHHGS